MKEIFQCLWENGKRDDIIHMKLAGLKFFLINNSVIKAY